MNIAKHCARISTLLVFTLISISSAFAETEIALDKDAKAALEWLYDNQPKAKEIGSKSAGILVFPNIVRAGFIVGGSGGNGVLYKGGKEIGHYSSGSVSVGLQAGVQSFGYAVFFTTEVALKNFLGASGWDIGASPTVVLVDAGAAANLNTTTLKSDIYAFIFNQEGLMAGIALQGQKISKLE